MIIGTRREVIILAAIGFVIGLAVGLYVAWMIWPLEDYASDPSKVRREYVEDYIVLIAKHHALDENIERAQARLNALGISHVEETVAQLTNRYMAERADRSTIRALAKLSYALGVGTSGMAVYLPAVTPTPSATATPAATSTATPTVTASPTMTPAPSPTSSPSLAESTAGAKATSRPSPTPTRLGSSTFLLTERRRICNEEAGVGQIEVIVRDSQGRGLSGVPIVITWDGGEERFFTGLKPEYGAGYADFELRESKQTYTVTLPLSGDVVRELAANPVVAGCPSESISVSWQLTFVGISR